MVGGGLSEPIETFLDQIITWRELGFNFAYYRDDHTSIDSIPDWAKSRWIYTVMTLDQITHLSNWKRLKLMMNCGMRLSDN